MTKEWSPDEQFTFYVASDLHIGNPNRHGRYPSLGEIQASLDDALEAHADAYFLLGDVADSGSHSQTVTELLRPYTTQGLQIIALLGNHEFYHEGVEEILKAYDAAGVTVLRNQSITLQKGDRRLGIVGAEQYPGYLQDQAVMEYGKECRQELSYAAATGQRQRFSRIPSQPEELHIMHYGPIVETEGSGDRLIHYGQGYDQLLDERAKSVHIHAVVHGHSHGPFPHEGNLHGQTEGGIPVFNVAAPVRRRNGLPLTKIVKV